LQGKLNTFLSLPTEHRKRNSSRESSTAMLLWAAEPTEKFLSPGFAQKNESFALLFGREKYGFL
jgi:tRNA C32,U32 (ribose-2'-O)-methylase TrmJ